MCAERRRPLPVSAPRRAGPAAGGCAGRRRCQRVPTSSGIVEPAAGAFAWAPLPIPCPARSMGAGRSSESARQEEVRTTSQENQEDNFAETGSGRGRPPARPPAGYLLLAIAGVQVPHDVRISYDPRQSTFLADSGSLTLAPHVRTISHGNVVYL